MRMVRVTIEYDMDDEDKSLSAELSDWFRGRVEIGDIIRDWPTDGLEATEGSSRVRIEPCGS